MAVVIYYRRGDLLSVAFLVWKGPLAKRSHFVARENVSGICAVQILEGRRVYEQSRSYLAFFRALPASTWGHYSQTLIFTATWGHPKTLKSASFRVLKIMFSVFRQKKNPIKRGKRVFAK